MLYYEVKERFLLQGGRGMKIYSRFIPFICGALLLTNISSLGQPNYLQDRFHSYQQKLTDFKDCFFGKKECSPKEKAVKYTTIIAATLVLLSAVIYVGGRIPGVIKESMTIDDLQNKMNTIYQTYTELLPQVTEYQKTLKDIGLNSPIAKFLSVFHEDKIERINRALEDARQMSFVDLKARKKALNNIASELNAIERNIKEVQKILQK